MTPSDHTKFTYVDGATLDYEGRVLLDPLSTKHVLCATYHARHVLFSVYKTYSQDHHIHQGDSKSVSQVPDRQTLPLAQYHVKDYRDHFLL